MTTTAFNTLEYFEKFKSAGFLEAQARIQVEALQDLIKNYDDSAHKDLATKSDIHGVHTEIHNLRAEIQDVRAEVHEVRAEIQDVRAEVHEVRAEIQDVRAEVRAEIHQLRAEIHGTKHEILKWVIGLIISQTAVIVAILALVK